MPDTEYMSREEVVAALNIKPSTLYAYVSRGVLRRVRHAGRRHSLYLREDVERLISRHPGHITREQAAATALRWGAPVISTSIGYIDEKGPVYRNRRALDLARSGASFESVAHLLLTGVWQPGFDAWPQFDMPPDVRRRLMMECKGVAPRDISKVFASAVLALGMQARDQQELTSGVGADVRVILHTLAGCFGALMPAPRFTERRGGESVAAHAIRASGVDGDDSVLSALNQALVILADHEMAAATFVARITASTNSDLYCCVASAVCAHAGSSMVTAALEADTQLFGPLSRRNRRAMLELVQQRGATMFGFNHPLYPKGDPRADYLLALSATMRSVDPKVPLLLDFLAEARQQVGALPGIAVALAVFCRTIGMPYGSAAALWMLSRTVGWIAHAMEQRTQAFMLRPRARYIQTIESVAPL